MDATKTIRKTLGVVEEFRKMDPLMSSTRMAGFLYIALHEGCSMRDLYQFLGVTQGSAFKLIKYLGDEHEEGLGLVTAKDVADPYPRKSLFLTHKGRRVIDTFQHYMQ